MHFPEYYSRVLITGGSGFIGGSLVRRLLENTRAFIFNLDKISYASDHTSINNVLSKLGESASNRYKLLKVDLNDPDATLAAVRAADPDLVFHLAAESHVDRSINTPQCFVESNVKGTFHLLEALRQHWDALPNDRQKAFRLHHISTDEVFGSLGVTGSFNENTPYDPRSPYSATKAASDHLVMAWHHTYGLPSVITNCSNNYGPWQFPEKLIPLVILKAKLNQPIPLYGQGLNVRDWLYVEDHVDALLLVATSGQLGRHYCIGGSSERTNNEVVSAICTIMDNIDPAADPYFNLVSYVSDRPGHDLRYAIDSSLITQELNWQPSRSFEDGLKKTVLWYLNNMNWVHQRIS